MRKKILGIALATILTTNSIFSNCALTTVKAAPAADECITVDGDLSDWDYIKKLYTGEGRMIQAAAFRTDDSIYIMRELDDMAQYNGEQMFFDGDGNNTTGYNGAEWMMQSGTLYMYNGTEPNQWAWEDRGGSALTVKLSDDAITAEYKIAISKLDNFDPNTFGINICPTDKNWGTFASYPAGTSDYAKVPAYEDVYQESDSVPITNVKFNATGDSLQAITDATMPGGIAGTFAAEGGDGVNYTYSLASSATYGVDNSKFTISGNKLMVGETMLSPGSYSIYVKVTSDIRSAKVPLTFMVRSASASAVITESVFSGQNGQWFAVNHNAANSIPTLKALKAATDGTNLYAYVDATTLSHNAAFYISVPETEGAEIDTWADSSDVNYKVDMEGTLYEYKSGDWQKVDTVTIFKTEVGAEISVPLTKIGNVGEQKIISVGVKDGETCYLPNKGMAMYQVITPYLSEMPSITHDGKADDWKAAGVQPIAKGTGTVGDIYAVHDNNWLHVMTTFSGVDADDWTSNNALSANLMINADADSSTGMQCGVYPEGSGLDFLAQDWYSVGSEANGGKGIEFFKYPDPGFLHTSKEYKKYTDLGEGNYCIEYAIPLSDMADLKTLSDDFYIGLHRSAVGLGDLNLQSTFTDDGGIDSAAMVYVPKYNTTVKVSATDEAFGDWKQVARAATNTSTDATCNLFATRSDDRLYTLVTNEKGGLNTVNTYYISTGDDTGYSISGFEKIDYIVKDAKLFKMVADNQMSEALDEVWMSYYNDNIEMQLYLEQIGNPKTIKIVWRGVNGSLQIPADNEMLNVTASFDMLREDGYYYPVEDFASFTNPYKGWALWELPGETYDEWASDYYYFDSDLIYVGLTWKDLQPNSEDEFLIEECFEKYEIDKWVAAGKRINLRFMMDDTAYMGVTDEDWAKGEEYVKNLVETKLKWDRMDIPMWLYEELVEYDKSNGGDGSGAGIFYWDPDGTTLGIGYDQGGFAPNYYSPKLIERHEEIIAKIAEYFDDTNITGHVMVGSLGHWGEFHVWPEYSGIWPTVDILDEYQSHYTKAFNHVKLGIRKPYPHAAANGYGLFNDIFGSDANWGVSGTQDFYKYFMNGNTDMGVSTDTTGKNTGTAGTAEQIEASKMPNFWKTSWSGGEFADGQIRVHLTNDISKDGTRGTIGCLDETRYCHVSWMGPCSPSNFYVGEVDAALYEANVYAMLKLMGYNFALEKITQVSNMTAGVANEISMVWNNEGVAPFYYEWPLELSLLDAAGNVVYKEIVSTEDVNITEWLPGRHAEQTSFTVPNSVEPGQYTLAVAILEKNVNDAGETISDPGIKLLIDGRRDDLRHPLYTVTVENSEYVPETEAPSTEAPSTEAPSTEAPSTEAPSTEAPSTEAPSTEAPSTEAPEADKKPSGSTSGSTSGTTNNTATGTENKGSASSGNSSEDTEIGDTIKYSKLKKALSKSEEGDRIVVEMGKQKTVSASILKTILEKKVDVTFEYDNGVEWSISHNDIGDGKLVDIDFRVTLNTEDIPNNLVTEVLGEKQGLQFNIKHKGDFGLKATLKLPIGKEFKGKTAEMYYYNEEAGQMELAGSDVVDKDGFAKYSFTHASDYLIVLNDEVVEDVTGDVVEDTEVVTTEDGTVTEIPTEGTTDAATDDATTDDEKDGGNAGLWIIIVIVTLVIIAAGVYVFKKKGEKGNE